MVDSYRLGLRDAATPGARMDALCEFVEFWLGPRQSSYGESPRALSERPLPMPLALLYEFAGRWPHRENRGSIGKFAVPAFSHQDSLRPLAAITDAEDGKIVFLDENQGVWDCRTLSEGEDPPVWANGDQWDEDGSVFSGERLVCESLSRLLVTFVLQELSCGARICLSDDGLGERFASERDTSVPVWLEGPYVYGSESNFFLWRGVLVSELWGMTMFSANHDEAIAFLEENQWPIDEISLSWESWRLDIHADGSACLRFLKEWINEHAPTPVGTFEFPDLLSMLIERGSDEGVYERDAMAFFRRTGQSGGIPVTYLHDAGLVTSLFRHALERAIEPNPTLQQLFKTKWPI
ncbi:hypothetical protein AB1L88_17770 [Tautonia sp. JC769]|uniref:hypothetical protein n=1 Tax=Tautonia sp. JC769 TaxID=3232135 RepID=UPI00345ADE0D